MRTGAPLATWQIHGPQATVPHSMLTGHPNQAQPLPAEAMRLLHSLMHKYSLSTCHVPGTVLPVDTAVSKPDTALMKPVVEQGP